ncbi:hypothetical protein PTHTG4_09730 [Parageobacillus thermoglucosidasius]|nr:hypothetical protein PTHTG4_09730 [Parageobacillus thermoglucosidasius]
MTTASTRFEAPNGRVEAFLGRRILTITSPLKTRYTPIMAVVCLRTVAKSYIQNVTFSVYFQCCGLFHVLPAACAD